MSEKKGSKKARSKDLTPKLSKDELLRRLKSVMEELANVDQDETTENYDELAASLVTGPLINHKDKDIKVCLACCLADILRIYAPEAPYNEEQLKAIFQLILSQLKILENPESALFKRAYYLLESLAMVKSFNVCCEIDAQDLVVGLFRMFFNIVNEKHNIKVKTFILDVLSAIIQESESLSQEILDAVLVNLVEPRKTAKASSYKLAASLIERCSTALEPYLQVFFNDCLILGKETDSDMERHIYDLILELNRISKSILLSVLPQLEFKLKSVEEQERLDVVKVLGTMFSEEESDLSNQNKPLWKSFLDRFIDISAEVRVECVQSGKQLLVAKPELVNDVADRMLERFHDTEERVRLQAVISVCEAAAERIDAVPERLMAAVKERMRDKKWPVRRAALTCIAKLYKGITISQTPDPDAAKSISWAPNKILHSYYQNSIEDRLCVERIVHGCLVPVSLDPAQRMNVLLNLYASFQDYALKAFDCLLKHRSGINNEFRSLLELHEEDGDGKERVMFTKILTLARSLPEPFKAQENLKKFVTMFNDKTLFGLLKVSTDVSMGCSKIKKAVADIVKKISAKNPIIETVKALLDRSCHMLVDSESLQILLKCIKTSIEGMDDDDNDDDVDDEMNGTDGILSHKAKRGLMLLKSLSSVIPDIFKTEDCYVELLQLIKHQNDFVVETGLQILCAVGDGLESFDRNLCSCFQPVLSKLAMNGTRRQGIFAVRCLSKILKDATVDMDRLLNTLQESLDFDSKMLMTTLASLGEIALYAPSIFESKHKLIIREFVVKEVLIVDRDTSKESQESEDEWGAEDEISTEARLKVQGIKLMIKWLLGLQSNHNNAAVPVFRLLCTILQHDGDLNGNGALNNKDKSRLRLAAANGMIKLVQNSNYADIITIEQYLQLALTVQDACYEVRQNFSVKLHKALEVLKLPLDYLAMFMLSAVDPSKDRKAQARQMISKNAQRRRDYLKQHSSVASRPYAILPEYSLPYVIYIMAHHPDFEPKRADSLNEAKEYLWFFLEPLLGTKAEHSSFLKKLTENIKQVKDAQDPDDDAANERLYVVCDAVIWLLTNKSHTLVLKDFPGNPVLPKKLFKAASKDAKPNTKNYLPASFHLAPKPKKPSVVDVKKDANKRHATKRTTRVRTKGEEFRSSVKTLAEEKQDGDSDGDSRGDSEMEVEEDDIDTQHTSLPNKKTIRASSERSPNRRTKIVDKGKTQKTMEDFVSKGKKQDKKKSKKEKQKVEEDDENVQSEDDVEDEEREQLADASPLRDESIEDIVQEEPVKSKQKKTNIRVAAGKRHPSKDIKEPTEGITGSKKRAKIIEPERMETNAESAEEDEEVREEKEPDLSKVENTSIPEEDTSVVLNVKRKNTRRR